jgi:hypothetical protein
MAERQRRMTAAARRELIDAIQEGRIDNATRFAEEFAEQHGLNPVTVRSTISRLRRDMGLTGRELPPGMETPGGVTGKTSQELRAAGINAVTFLALDNPADPKIARLGAAVLLRYEKDDVFRKAVDERRPEVEKLEQQVSQLLEATEVLSAEERANLARLFNEA